MYIRRIEDILLEAGIVDPETLHVAQDAARDNGGSVAAVLIKQKKVAEEELLDAVARAVGLPRVAAIADEDLDYGLVERLPIHYLKSHRAIPFKGPEGVVRVAIFDPFATDVIDDLHALYRDRRIEPVVAPAGEIESAINRTFGRAEGSTDDILQNFEDEDIVSELEEMTSQDLLAEEADAPIIKLVNHILAQAVKNGASDIHLEPFHDDLQVRFRMDGVLQNVYTLPRRLYAPVVSRIKIMARLNIAEKRLPQDGRMEVKLGNRLVDLRVSLLPTAFGERVVLRLLEKTAKLLDLDELGLNRDNLIHLKQFLNLSHGIILVTGPTGSGKTTSLYAALSHINAPDKNILTIEDPIEYQIEGIGQMQVNPKIGLTFASGLRSIVRQDPDVILIGEIRDLETAEIAIQAALTGHLVLSTLHTNDAPSAVTRLIKMGIEPFLISSAVRAIIAQRLVRRICPECRAQYTPPDRAQAEKEFAHFALDGELTKPLGCDACFGTGYRGRTALFEFMRMTEKLQDFILTTSDANQIRSLAMAEGMTSLRQDGVEKVIGGVTTTDEVLKATLI